MNVTAMLTGRSVSSCAATVVVMYSAPLSSYSRFEVSISFISSRVGTSMPSVRSTSFSSSGVGSSRSIQIASSGIFGGEPGVVRASPCGCWKKMFSMPWDAARRRWSAAVLMRGELFDDAGTAAARRRPCVWSVRYLPLTTTVGTELIW